MMAEVQDRHMEAARKALGIKGMWRNGAHNMVGIFAQALADQEAEIADALEAEFRSIELHGTVSGPAGIIARWARRVRSGEWRGK